MKAARRRQRLLRVRIVEHRAATARLVAADAALSAILGIAERVHHLRATARTATGGTTGMSIQIMGEFAMRLDSARSGLDAPVCNARFVRDIEMARRQAAHVAEERVRRLHVDASRRDEVACDLRAAAMQPFRRDAVRGPA